LSSFSDFVRLDVDRLVFKYEGGVISRDIKTVPLFAGIHFATINIEYLGYKISRDVVVEVKGIPPPIKVEERKVVGLSRIRMVGVDVRLPGVKIRNIGRVSLGRVVVDRYVGRDGYGYVYAGYLDGRRVAVKLPCDVLEKRKFRRRDVEKFIREARIVKRLKHPNIVELLDYD